MKNRIRLLDLYEAIRFDAEVKFDNEILKQDYITNEIRNINLNRYEININLRGN